MITLYNILDFGARNWWAHQQLRAEGKHAEARRAERLSILADVQNLRKIKFVMIGHGRWMAIPDRHETITGYGDASHSLVLACLLLGIPCVDYSQLDLESAVCLPVPEVGVAGWNSEIGMLDQVPFEVYAAIARKAGAYLYNVPDHMIDKYRVFQLGKRWDVKEEGIPAGMDEEQVRWNIYAFGADIHRFERKLARARKETTRRLWQKKIDEFRVYLQDNERWLRMIEREKLSCAL